jgi:hypothetical protein
MGLTFINDETPLECPKCHEMVTAEQYDAYSFSECHSRKLRRDYKSIVKIWNKHDKNQDYYFCCPYCNEWARVNKIRLYGRKVQKEETSSLRDELLDKTKVKEVGSIKYRSIYREDKETKEEEPVKKIKGLDEFISGNAGVFFGTDVELEDDDKEEDNTGDPDGTTYSAKDIEDDEDDEFDLGFNLDDILEEDDE